MAEIIKRKPVTLTSYKRLLKLQSEIIKVFLSVRTVKRLNPLPEATGRGFKNSKKQELDAFMTTSKTEKSKAKSAASPAKPSKTRKAASTESVADAPAGQPSVTPPWT